ncbi:MAG: hypothetical protein A2W23_01450 [Planctomycetes bacterium RBG_16_43_13]|nr:MAG: hypothetical protein A2W23_01450 [Planctomycetes bacterium RBG_16_43_13]
MEQGASISLREAAEKANILVGAAVFPDGLKNTYYADTLVRQFNFLTPENHMKWGIVHPTPNKWNFAPADALVGFAIKHNIKIKGHALIWHRELPKYVDEKMSSEQFRQAVQEHIHKLVSHYKGKVYAWDVVNEAIDDKEGLRKTIFLEKLGENYIDEVFRLAHRADPDAILIYNDYGADGLGSKSDRVYALVKRMVKEDIPIHGVGLQMHISATSYPKPVDVAANIRRISELGLKIFISEMDVQIRELSGNLSRRLEVQRQIYHDIIAESRKVDNFVAVTFWGFTDAHSWIDYEYGPDDPLLFDEDYKPKPAYFGLLDALTGK